jgi:ribosomal protein S18 acetylase RimI-like enzyme
MTMQVQVVVGPVDHTSASVAERIHAIQMAAYSEEARLIGAVDFAPLSRTLEYLRSSPEKFFVAHVGGELVGTVGIEPGGRGRIGISTLAVIPTLHRRGIGRALLQHIIELNGDQELHVQTAVRNVPALALYQRSGFTEVLRWFVDAETLELVALRRLPP